MTRPPPSQPSRSLRAYGRLLDIYPRAFLQEHRAEMLQNFVDLEDAATSKMALWLSIGKDLTMSLVSQFLRSRLGRYVIGVFAAWILLFVAGYVLHGPTPGYPVWHVFEGFLLGMLAMYIAIRFYETPQNRPHS